MRITAIKPSRTALYSAELVLVVLLSLLSARTVLQFGPDIRVRGLEYSYLIGSGAIADVVYDATGGIPLWNSWMGRGEPLLENSFSYVNNPFMFLPVLAWGMFDGPKVAIAVHAVIAGVGGWMLAYVVGLRSGGRLLSALLFAGSGGIVGAIGMGFYQMALSQAYVPWVYAGVLGTLRRRDRWSVGIFVVATCLLVFAGTFWYVLPTAIGCALLIAFNLIERNPAGRWRLSRTAIERLALATLFILLVGATRVIPQAINHAYVSHVEEFFPSPARDFLETSGRYFSTDLPDYLPIPALTYFYTLAPAFFLILLVGRLLIIPAGGKTPGTWRVVIPAAIAWLVFTSWGQEGGPVWVWLYERFPLLREWRLVTRMLAAGAPFLIMIAAIWFDDLLGVSLRWARSESNRTAIRIAAAAASVGLVGLGAVAAVDVLTNWERQSGMEPVVRPLEPFFALERTQRPSEFISVQDFDFYGYLPHYDFLIRAAYGNPDYKASGIAPTLGTTRMMDYPAPEALEYHEELARWLQERGYSPLPRPAGIKEGTRWINPNIPPYAFSAPASVFAPDRQETLTASEVTPVEYQYQTDTITVTLPQSSADEVVVVTETAYPGWRVRVNGNTATLESVGGLIGVRLSASSAPSIIEFAYRPTLLTVSSLITLVGVALLILYLLRADRWVRRQQPVQAEPEPPIPVPVAIAPMTSALTSSPPPTVEAPAPERRPSRAVWRTSVLAGVAALIGIGLALGVAIAAYLRGNRPHSR